MNMPTTEERRLQAQKTFSTAFLLYFPIKYKNFNYLFYFLKQLKCFIRTEFALKINSRDILSTFDSVNHPFEGSEP